MLEARRMDAEEGERGVPMFVMSRERKRICKMTSVTGVVEKPVELALRALTYSSRPGEVVLDLFGGSGSTLIAAEKLGRRARLMEIDPAYPDVIVRRWEQFTGEKTILDGDGRSFEEVADERRRVPA
jgi:DNA modification methylase